jgi:hypothetical protein
MAKATGSREDPTEFGGFDSMVGNLNSELIGRGTARTGSPYDPTIAVPPHIARQALYETDPYDPDSAPTYGESKKV